MGVSERRAREKEELRRKILGAASQLFVEEGFENVSIRKIADRIEYSPATIYLYFKDKAELIAAICEDSFSELLEAVSGTDQETDPLRALRRGLRAYIEFGLSHPHHYLVVFGVLHPKENPQTDHDPPQRMPGLEAFDALRAAIAGCMKAGVIAQGDIETASQTTWMCVHGVTALLITQYEVNCSYFPWLDKGHLIDSSLDLVIAGLKNIGLVQPPQK